MIHIKYVCDNESRKLIVIHYINTIREAMDVIQNIDDYLSRFPEEARVKYADDADRNKTDCAGCGRDNQLGDAFFPEKWNIGAVCLS